MQQKGFAIFPVIILVILIAGAVIGLRLIQTPQIFSPKAQQANCPVFTSTYNENGFLFFAITPAPGNPVTQIKTTQNNVFYNISAQRASDVSELTFPQTGEINQLTTFNVPPTTVKIYLNISNTVRRSSYYTSTEGHVRFDPDGVLKAEITDSCGVKQVVFDRNGMQITTNPSPSASPSLAPSPSASANPSDIDGNNIVDIFDFNLLVSTFGQTGSNLPADLNHNGVVDIFDFNILVSNFNN